MRSDWREVSISDIAEITPTRSLKKGALSPFIEMSALPIDGRDIPITQIGTRHFSGSGSRFSDGDVLMARITPCLENGKTSVVSGLGKGVIGHGSTEFIVLAARNSEDASFVYYLARHPDFRDYAIQHMEGTSGRQRVSAGAVGQYRFVCPPELQRKEIANTLSALDDKIFLLQKANTTLEAIAQTLFKSWFANFDPVRAKAKGFEPAGIDTGTAALFPSKFEESTLGLSPKGWSLGRLGDVCENSRRQAKPEQLPQDTPYIGLEHMPRHSIALVNAGTAEGLESGKFWFDRDDILFGKLRPYFHKVGLAPYSGVCSTDILVIRPTKPSFLGYAAMHVFSDELVAYTTQLSNGAKMPRTNWQDVAGFKVVLPPEEIARAYNVVARATFERIYANIICARTLAKMRDALLPRLMSGKLRIQEAQEQVEDAIA